MLISAKQLDANRRNAERSAGPVSPEGKAAVSRNAATHGLYARSALLPEESPEAFDQYYDSLFAALLPEGQLEIDLFEKMANCQWKLRHIAGGEFLAYEDRHRTIRNRRYSGDAPPPLQPLDVFYQAYVGAYREVDHFSQHRARLNREYYKAMRELRLIQNDRRRREDRDAGAPPETPPPSEPAGIPQDIPAHDEIPVPNIAPSAASGPAPRPEPAPASSSPCPAQSPG